MLAAGDIAGDEPHTAPPLLELTVWQERENLNGDYNVAGVGEIADVEGVTGGRCCCIMGIIMMLSQGPFNFAETFM